MQMAVINFVQKIVRH